MVFDVSTLQHKMPWGPQLAFIFAIVDEKLQYMCYQKLSKKAQRAYQCMHLHSSMPVRLLGIVQASAWMWMC